MIRTINEKLDYSKVWENTVTALCQYLEQYDLKAMVLGISGGIDSTVVAAIGYEVYKQTGRPLIGLSLMSSTNQDDEIDAASMVGVEFCTEFYKKYINDNYENVLMKCKDINPERTSIADGNIKARLRMIMLYDTASIRRGIVLDTDQLSEHLTGFWTIKGDESDLDVIGGLWKHEVYEFAVWIRDNIYPESKSLDMSIALIPTDGNGVAAGGDMGQIAPGHTYNDVDDILSTYVEYVGKHTEEYQIALNELYEKYGQDTVDRVIRRHCNSQFKRCHRPLIIDPVSGEILQNNWMKLSETI
jgi:NAD+ synthetase